MKLSIIPSILLITYTKSDDEWERDYIGFKPASACGSILEQHPGFWITVGDNNNVELSDDCDKPDTENARCLIGCANDNDRLIVDRTGVDKWDRALAPENNNKNLQSKFLVKCKCETTKLIHKDTNEEKIEFTKCKWKPHRWWSEGNYRDHHNIDWSIGLGKADGQFNDQYNEFWKKMLKRKRRSASVSRTKRSSTSPKATFYCESQAPEEVKDVWKLRNDQKGQIRVFDNKKGETYTSCGDMNELFPGTGGSWRCRGRQTHPDTGEITKIWVDHTDVPYGAICAWGCDKDGNWESKAARVTCAKPWIARPTTKWETKDIWRRFTGLGMRVYKQELLNCGIY